MTLQELLEQDKEKLLQTIEGAKEASDVVPLLERECDRLLYAYNEECTDDDLRALAASLMLQVRTGTGLVNTDGPTVVWERGNTAVSGTSKKKGEAGSSPVWMTAGLTCLAVSVVIHFLPGKAIAFIPLLILDLLLPSIGAALIYTAGRKSKKRLTAPAAKSTIMTQTTTDASKVYRIFRAQVLTADRELEKAAGSKRLADRRSGQKQLTAISDKDIRLIGDLLEASYSGDGEYALDKLKAVKFRLHQLGIEAIDADNADAAEHPEWFDTLPADQEMTLRPALVMNGQLVLKGLKS